MSQYYYKAFNPLGVVSEILGSWLALFKVAVESSHSKKRTLTLEG